MMMLPLGNKRPVYGEPVRINWNHPLAQGLIMKCIFNERPCLPLDLVTRTPFSMNNAPTWAARGMTFASASSQYIGTPTLNSTEFTLAAWVYPTNANYRSIISGTGTGRPEFRMDSGRTLSILSQGALGLGTSSGTISLNAWSHVAVTYKTPNGAFYINGVPSGTFSTAYTLWSSATAIRVGGADNGEYWAGDIDDACWYNRVLTASEINSLYRDPYQMLEYDQSFHYFAPAASSTVYSRYFYDLLPMHTGSPF